MLLEARLVNLTSYSELHAIDYRDILIVCNGISILVSRKHISFCYESKDELVYSLPAFAFM